MAVILIVDDRPANRDYLRTLLGYGGHRLLEAADGAEALSSVRSERPDLVIADVLMPTMDGYEFVRLLREDTDIATTPVIFCTAHYHEAEASALARACGVSGVLTKPCEPAAVIRAVNSALLGDEPVTSPTPQADEAFDREHLRLVTDKLSEKVNELRSANERLTALLELGLQLGSEHDADRLLDGFAHAAREVAGARFVIVNVNGGGRKKRYHASGLDVVAVEHLGRPPTNDADAVAAQLRYEKCRGQGPIEGLPPGFPPIHAWLAVPVRSLKRTYGWALFIDKLGADSFRPDDERLADILAAQVGRVYENGSLYTEVLRQSDELREKATQHGRSEQRFRALLESAPDAMVIVDAQGRIAMANQRAERLFGYLRSELIGRSADVLVPERLRERSRESRQPYLDNPNQSPPGEGLELIGRQADGSEFPMEINLSPLQTDDGLVVIIVVRNIARRKQSEEALRASEESLRQIRTRLEHILEFSPAVIYSSMVEDNRIRSIAWISDNVREMMGQTPKEAQSEDWWFGNIHPEDAVRVKDNLHRWLPVHGQLIDEYRFRRKDGEYLWVRNELRLLRDSTGTPVEVVGSWSDITERKRLEDQILQSQKMEAIGKLAGGIAHDFNNLLTVINGYCELLLGSAPLGDDNREALVEIHNAGERAASLTRQLLAFSRKAVLSPVVLDLNALLADLQKMLVRLIGEDVELRVQPRSGWKVKVDAGQMEQTVMNLAVNARDAMPRGGKLIIETADVRLDDAYVRRHQDAAPGDYVLLAVSDTGTGMDAATRARIFDPFFTTKGPNQGTGLGLSVVHGIVKQSGGRIEVYSEPGIGSTFKIYLPKSDDDAPPSRLVVPPASGRGTETLLLVEDEAGVRSLAKLILERHGYTVLEARNGEEALPIGRDYAGEIHLMVTDTVMPKLGGWQLAQQLALVRPKMKVLFLSGYTDDAIVHHGLIDPDTPFLEKPFSSEALLAKIRELLDASG